MSKKVLIVGGVAGGASVATRLRRLDEEAEIIIFEKGEYISFANCGLPYHIGEVIKDRKKLLVQTPQSLGDRFNIDVRVFSEVTQVDTENKKIIVNSKDRGVYEENYDYLVLSPGGKAIKPSVEGVNSKKIHTLKTIADMDNIKREVDSVKIKHAVVIGGGYIGVEACENLKERGVNVTLVEGNKSILAPFDEEISAIIEQEMNDMGINIMLNTIAKSFKDRENSIDIFLDNESIINADLVILAIGVTPDVKFLENSGLEFGPRGHIIVDEFLETNKKNVYALGDAILVKDLISKENVSIPLAGPANRQGRIVANNICGYKEKYEGTLGTSIIKVFSLTAASTGNNERLLRKRSEWFDVIYIHPNNHAGYYPGAIPMTIKLLFNKKEKILGAQAVGYDGVDKVIDVIATAIKLNGKVTDLKDLELCYAPPFNSAKSPVNMLGFVADNILSGKEEMITPLKLSQIKDNDYFILDVREDLEWEKGHIKEATHIPLNSLRHRLDEIPRGKEILVYCQVGVRGHIASSILRQKGFKVKNITGGYKTYKSSEFIKTMEDNKNIEKEAAIEMDKNSINIKLEKDLCGLSCPGPLMEVKKHIDSLEDGEVLKVNASDPGFFVDIKSWCEKTNNTLLDVSKNNGIISAIIKKGSMDLVINNQDKALNTKDNKTIIVFSGDLDKAIASFIIANGAASMGKKVTMFFTFWGLNILRKSEGSDVKKDFMEKMFGSMMPRGSEKLKLSKMNMGGIGPKLIRKIMNDKNVSSLEELIKSAMDSGIEMIACQMTLDLLGIKKEELIDGVKIGGVGYMLGEAEESNMSLFI